VKSVLKIRILDKATIITNNKGLKNVKEIKILTLEDM